MSVKDKGKNKHKKNTVKFSKAYSEFFAFLCSILSVFLKAKYHRSKAFEEQKKNGAMLLVSNHLSAYDFVYFSVAMKGAALNYVVAENMMYSTPVFATLIKSYHAITKKQFFADVQCIKSIKRYLDAGVSVLICPEGKVSADGMTGTIPPSIAKLVQWLGYPVGYLKLSGASIARPKWAHNLRKGRVSVECDMLFDKDTLQNCSKEEILQSIECALAHNEHKWQIENGIEFKGKHYAEELQRLLYRCPKCGKEFAMESKDDHILCLNCGNDVIYTKTGQLVPADATSVCPERIDLWCAEQRKLVAKEILNEDFRLSDAVNLFVENAKSNGYRFVAGGKLTLDKNTLRFETDWESRPIGVKAKFGVNAMDCDFRNDGNTEKVEDEFKLLEFPVKNFDTIANLPGTSLDVYDAKHVYRFMFSHSTASTKYVLAVEEMYKSNQAK